MKVMGLRNAPYWIVNFLFDVSLGAIIALLMFLPLRLR